MIIFALLIGAFVCIVPIAILVLIISAVVKKSKQDKDNFDETIRNVYIYIILIITLIGIIGGTIGAFRVGLDILLPEESTYSNSYSIIDKNENIIELATTISLLISVIPIFIYHNKLVKQSKNIKKEKNINE